MSRRRISGTKSRTHHRRARGHDPVTPHRFIGVDLGGGKADTTSLAVLDYYPSQKKLFLTHIHEKIKAEGDTSSDQILYEIIQEHKKHLEYLCFDAPLKFPKCIRCKLPCPGYEKCKEPEIVWMWKYHKVHKKKHKRAKIFTPYTQRAAEFYLSTIFDPDIYPIEALGANSAPMAARAHFLARRLQKFKIIEVAPRLTVLRMGLELDVNKSHLKHYKHSVGGDESRQVFLQTMVKNDLVFIYHQDLQKLIDDPNNFDAFMAAYTGFLKFLKKTEKMPSDFPKADGWIEFPADKL